MYLVYALPHASTQRNATQRKRNATNERERNDGGGGFAHAACDGPLHCTALHCTALHGVERGVGMGIVACEPTCANSNVDEDEGGKSLEEMNEKKEVSQSL